MDLTVPYASLVAFLLATARAIGFTRLVPPFSSTSVIPTTASVGIAAALGLVSAHDLPHSELPTTTITLVGALIVQLLTGVSLGYVVSVLVGSFAAAGSLLDLGGGLNLPSAIDPLGLDQAPAIGSFYSQVVLLLLFAGGGWPIVLQGYFDSFRAPPFVLADVGRVAYVVVADVATFFLSALEIAGPVLIVLFAVQIVLAVTTKAAPQINAWIFGLPIQVVLSLVLVGLAISAVPGWLQAVVLRATNDMHSMFGGIP